MTISLIAALSRNRVIGKNNDLPWRLPDDMRFFMETTKGHCVIMGRKNYESLPFKFRPLPERTNIVVTRQKDFIAEGCQIVHSLEEALASIDQESNEEIFVVGGAEIYKLALPYAHKLYLTEIDAEIEGDTFFPLFDKTIFQEQSRKHHAADAKHIFAFDFVLYSKEV
jgi:dihydrofolate reductase